MDGKNLLKHVERLTEINKLRNVASYWLYSANILAMHGPMNVKLKLLLSCQYLFGFCIILKINIITHVVFVKEAHHVDCIYELNFKV